jgi:DNA-binding transcriptional ArsR family regulator
MKRLVAAGLVIGERRGTWTFYRLDPAACTKLAEVCALPPGACDPAA